MSIMPPEATPPDHVASPVIEKSNGPDRVMRGMTTAPVNVSPALLAGV